MKKQKINLSNIRAYITGHVRYYFYYHEMACALVPFMLPSHIREQIDFRINYMRKSCYVNGSCDMCGCLTTALQMANKACDGACYPSMMNAKDWGRFTKGQLVFRDENGLWEFFPEVGVQPEQLRLYTRDTKYGGWSTKVITPVDKTTYAIADFKSTEDVEGNK